jgi:hypothetical protein
MADEPILYLRQGGAWGEDTEVDEDIATSSNANLVQFGGYIMWLAYDRSEVYPAGIRLYRREAPGVLAEVANWIPNYASFYADDPFMHYTPMALARTSKKCHET